MTDYPGDVRRHPVAQLLLWSARGNQIKNSDLDEADVPTGLRERVLGAAPQIRRLWAAGAQQDAATAAAAFAADYIDALPAGHGPKRDPLPDDPRELAKLVRRN